MDLVLTSVDSEFMGTRAVATRDLLEGNQILGSSRDMFPFFVYGSLLLFPLRKKLILANFKDFVLLVYVILGEFSLIGTFA